MSSIEANKELVRRFLNDVLNERRFSAIPEFVSADRTEHFAGALTTYLALAAFPDFQLTMEHMVAENDIVTVLATFTGTHQHKFLDVPATNRGVTGRVAFTFRVQDELISESWAEIEPWTLLGQLTDAVVS